MPDSNIKINLVSNFDELAGKTIDSVVCSEYIGDVRCVLIVCKDKSACLIDVEHDYEGDYSIYCRVDLRLDEFSHDDLLKAGVIDLEWIEEQRLIKEQQAEKIRQCKLAKEKAEYERLKQKFEAEGGEA